MRGYSYTKSSSFQFGAPSHKYTRSGEDHGDFGDNFYKMLCSWLSFRDFISIGSIAEVDKIRHVFSAMFQANQNQVVKKHKKTKYREAPHIVKIDLDKIDKNLKLSSKEKRRLRHLLNQIKYRELGTKSKQKEIKKGKENLVALGKSNKTVVKNKNSGRTKKTKTLEKSKYVQDWQKGECKHCNICSEEGNSSCAKRNKGSRVTSITASEERVFKTLMSLDRSCCGDSFKTLFDQKRERTYITQKQNINIENLELKYVQPTCLVQYTGMNGELSIDVLKSHLGCRVSFSPSETGCWNDDEKRNSYILKDSLSTTENKRTDVKQRKEKNITEGSTLSSQQKIQPEISREFIKTHWSEIPKEDYLDCGTLLASGDKLMSPQGDFEDLQKQIAFEGNEEYSHSEMVIEIKKTASKCQKFKQFAKKFLCTCGTEDDGETRHRRRDRDVNARLGKRLNTPKGNVKHMTEQEFLNRKRERNK